MKKSSLTILIVVIVILFFPLQVLRKPSPYGCEFAPDCNGYTSIGLQLWNSITR